MYVSIYLRLVSLAPVRGKIQVLVFHIWPNNNNCVSVFKLFLLGNHHLE